MAKDKELRPCDSEHQRRESFRKRRATLFGMARDLSEEFGAHVAVIAFSPAGEPYAFGAPTADSVLRTYLPTADGSAPNPTPHAPSPGAAAGVGAAGGIALINTLGQFGGIVSPVMVGWVKDLTGSTTPALYVIGSLCLVAAGLLLFAMPASLRRSDRGP